MTQHLTKNVKHSIYGIHAKCCLAALQIRYEPSSDASQLSQLLLCEIAGLSPLSYETSNSLGAFFDYAIHKTALFRSGISAHKNYRSDILLIGNTTEAYRCLRGLSS